MRQDHRLQHRRQLRKTILQDGAATRPRQPQFFWPIAGRRCTLLISVRKRFVFLSMPKAASTSVETALAPHCDIVASYPVKHMTFRGFDRYYEPMLRRKCGLERSEYEVVCLFREPISWLNSWYRYRSRERRRVRKRNKFTGELSFSDFLEAYLQDRPPAFAKVGDPARFVSTRKGKIGVDRIFKYEDLEAFRTYVSGKLKSEIEFPNANVSPQQAVEYDVPAELRDRVREKLAAAFRIYESL